MCEIVLLLHFDELCGHPNSTSRLQLIRNGLSMDRFMFTVRLYSVQFVIYMLPLDGSVYSALVVIETAMGY